MARRLHKTWADYMVIGISPALIIVMIWSLVVFLIAGGYRGPYSLRVSFIFAMFVMGAVLTTRISIEEGREYATLFAIPLGIVMCLAAVRFTPIGGLSLLLIALIWWCASKLTWDCTVIDEAEDASGEGLLQVMGVEGEGEGEDAPAAATTEGTTETADARPAPDETRIPRVTEDPIAWWRARVARRRQRRHAPGLWVIYFALVALPIFGFLHRYIPATDAARRRAAFFLLCSYVASSLGLLMTTSFLNLRRYLRQRRLQMPTEMAGMWLSVGALLIAMVLIACVVLPRPGAAVAISQLPFSIHWPDYRKPNRFAVGGEGVQSDQQTGRTTPQKTSERGGEARHGRKSSAPSKSKSGRSASGGQSGKRTGRSQNGAPSPSARQGEQPGTKSPRGAGKPANNAPKSRGTQSAGSQSGKSAARNSAPSRSVAKTESHAPARRTTRTPSHNSSSAKSPTRPTKTGGQNKTSRASDNGSNAARRHDAPNQSGQTPPPNQQQQPRSGQTGKPSESASKQPSPPRQTPAQARPKNKPTGQPPSRAGPQRQSDTSSKAASRRSGQSQRAQSSSRSVFSDSSKQNAVEKSSVTRQAKNNSTSARQPASPRPSPAHSISKLFSATTSVLGKILKVVFVLGLLAFVAFLAWKYRETIQLALRQLLDDLRRIWASLFGGQKEAKPADAAAAQESAPQRRTFASFSNPFVSGTAERWTMEQTVHYTFAALEAWATEQDSGRASEQTPLEFAQELAGRFPEIGAEATTLADLYSRVAYGRRRVSKRHEQTLARLWRLMARTALPRPAAGASMGAPVANS